MEFIKFSEYLSRLETISKRLEITGVLAELYTELAAEAVSDRTQSVDHTVIESGGNEEVQQASYLLLGSLRPPYESLEFQMSSKMVMRSLAGWRSTRRPQDAAPTDLFGTQDTSTDEAWVAEQFRTKGDLGLVAEEIGQVSLTAGHLRIADVYARLETIAQLSGSGSQEQKAAQLTELLTQLDPLGAKYVCRIIIGKMRLGFSTMTVLDALSWSRHTDKRDHGALEDAYQKRADIGYLAKVYLAATTEKERTTALAQYTVVAGTPVVPQLCQRIGSPREVIEKMGSVYAEPKYDGLRAQIHIFTVEGKKIVKVFTRSLEDVTHMFPEAVRATTELQIQSAVFDSEAIGFSPQTGKLLPFQETITRKRKHGIEEKTDTVPIRFYIFDLLYLNGESYIDKPLRERKVRLKDVIIQNEYLHLTWHLETSSPEELQKYHENELGDGLEGIVIKQPTSAYVGGRKGWHWVKLKELAGTRGKLVDTLDCIVLGYYPGQGKRTQFGIGAFLVGVRSGEDIVTVAKIGTGLTDDQFREIKQLCDPHKVAIKPKQYQIPKTLEPAAYIAPQVVVEIAADEVTRSPLHTAGLALRFPRMVRIRHDKSVDDASTIDEVKTLAAL